MMINKLTAALVLGAVIWTGGCSTVNSVEPAQLRAQPNLIQDRRVVTDKGLNDAVRVVEVNEGQVSNNLLKVQVEVINLKNSPQRFDYKFEWFNRDGMNVESPLSTWKQASILPKERKWLSAIAPRPDVVDFQLKLIEAR